MSSKLIVLILEYTMLCIDIFCNVFVDYFGNVFIHRLSVYVLQDLCLIISIIILILLFFTTKVLKSGLIKLVLAKFWPSLAISLLYLLFNLVLQYMIISMNWKEQTKSDKLDRTEWMKHTDIVITLIIQRILSTIYYFFYRNAANQLHDKIFIENCKKSLELN